MSDYEGMYRRRLSRPGEKNYTELSRLETFEEKYDYLKLGGYVGDTTFGSERYLNQTFYKSILWRNCRDLVIARDLGNDLGVEGRPIHDRISVHHMNPMAIDDIRYSNLDIIDPEYLIAVSHRTHNAIHYGDASLLQRGPVERRPGDTKLW